MGLSNIEALREAVQGAPSVQESIQKAAEEVTEEKPDEESLVDQEELALESEDSAPAEDETGDDSIYSLSDLEGLSVRMADDADPVSIIEIIEKAGQIESQQKELESQRELLERRQKDLQQQALQFGQQANGMSDRMRKAYAQISAIEGAYPGLEEDWKKREATDPGQVALERQQIGQQYGAAQAEFQQAQQEATQQQRQARTQWNIQQHQILESKIPEWKDPGKRQALQKDLLDFAGKQYGASQQELANIDARTLLLLRDAMDGVKARNGAKEAVAKVRRKPKAIPRGKARAQFSKQQVAEMEQRARSTKNRKDIIDATKGIIAESINRR